MGKQTERYTAIETVSIRFAGRKIFLSLTDKQVAEE